MATTGRPVRHSRPPRRAPRGQCAVVATPSGDRSRGGRGRPELGSGRPSQIARQVPAGMREAGTCPGPSPPGRYPAGSASRTHDHVERCLQCLRQRLRVRYWLRFRFRFRRRQWSRLRPAFRRRRQRHWRRHWRRHWWRLHRFGPRRLRLRGFTGTICGHPVMIPSRALCPPRGGRPVSTSCALTCACPTSRTRAIYPTPARWHPERTGVPIKSWTCNARPGGAIRWSARTGTRGGRGG